MSTEDDKRMIVETETVQTPAQNLLPVQPEDKAEDEATSIITQGDGPANLIDHNPLSIHNGSGAIRNKKSSLLIDSFLGKEATPSSTGLGSTQGTTKTAVQSAAHPKPSHKELLEESQPRLGVPEDHKPETLSPRVPGPLEHAEDGAARKTRDPPNKADFFAARLASAVGENEISDSEETFVYESTANSTNNAAPGESRAYGIPAKMSAPLLNHNTPNASTSKLLNRAKATRHTSIAAIPPAQPSEQSDDLHSLRYVNRANPQEIRSVRSYTTMPRSPGKRLSLISLAQNGGASAPRKTSRLASSNSNANARRKVSQKRQLRTTASKIFDAHGASLRRYSGVPDDVNLEDYIEQTGGELTPKKFVYHSDSEFDDEPVSYTQNADNEEEDNHSMFYYSHPKNDIEARHPLSDYDEAEEEGHPVQGQHLGYQPELDYYADNYYLQPTEATALKKKTSHYNGYSPHNFYTTKTTWTRFRNFVYFAFVVSFLLTLGFISGFLLATNKELHDLQLSKITSVLVSADELVFDVIATAFNPGFFTVEIQRVELDIFAKTSHLDPDDGALGTPYETILLGTVENLENSLQFQGGFFRRNYDHSKSSVKLVHPGSVDEEGRDDARPHTEKIEDGLAKWRQLIHYEFDLIVRGNMYYKMPFFNSEKSVGVQCVTLVNPYKGGNGNELLGNEA
ncbi:LAQU0S13e00870g1_1 [Lachancea quebecensis]|uniref:LAQU0S13e00870g1_1 n=1 Tax=Lachancea quebecensis TaxID=1654605 RepID=A0A0P1KVI8_9SACH|nr:LAQU0S13e00870g1_1 [Lachancea quebecensis]